MIMHARDRQKRWHRNEATPGAIREHQNIHARAHKLLGLLAQLLDGIGKGMLTVIGTVGGHDSGSLETLPSNRRKRGELHLVQQRCLESHEAAVGTRIFE